jgi:hypothetical protein
MIPAAFSENDPVASLGINHALKDTTLSKNCLMLIELPTQNILIVFYDEIF